MPRINFSKALRDEYQRLFDTCIASEDKSTQVESILSKIGENQEKYAAVEEDTGVPWYFIAVIHNMESSLNFNRHLHNGDPLTERTLNVPQGRPKKGNPPFTWEESAIDALKFKRLGKWKDWSLPGPLYKLEDYNGWGYRLYHPHVLSPYLWSYSNHYVSGKYVADGRWSDTAVSKQAGAAVLLRRMAEKGSIQFFELSPIGPGETLPLLHYSSSEKSTYAEELQMFLNKFPSIYVKVDSYPGEKTSEAFKKITGYYLYGDPRIET